jgi:DNA polymerase-3 subunit epsilon
MRQIVLDTETTGLEPKEGHRIIEIACLELINRKLTGKYYQQYINPERSIDEAAFAVHGITNSFLEEKPTFSLIADEFMAFIDGAELIIHNAPFDIGFIKYELSLTQQKWKPLEHYCKIIDTLVIARQLHVGQRNSLDALCKRYGIDNSKRELHGALLDANLLAQVYLAMTGGQGSLFDELQQPIKTEIQNKITLSTEKTLLPKNLTVIKASPDELALHQKKCQKLAEKGKCLWLIPIVKTAQQHQ